MLNKSGKLKLMELYLLFLQVCTQDFSLGGEGWGCYIRELSWHISKH
jgi:hypothetical protein